MDLVSVVEKVGVPIGLLLFFVWWTWSREKSLAADLAQTKTFVQGTLVELVRQAATALTEHSACSRELSSALKARPCLLNTRILEEPAGTEERKEG